MLHQIKAHQFYNDLGLYHLCQVLQKKVEFKDFSRLFNNFPVLFKADLISKNFFAPEFKYFSSLCEPCVFQSQRSVQERTLEGTVCQYQPTPMRLHCGRSFRPVMISLSDLARQLQLIYSIPSGHYRNW